MEVWNYAWYELICIYFQLVDVWLRIFTYAHWCKLSQIDIIILVCITVHIAFFILRFIYPLSACESIQYTITSDMHFVFYYCGCRVDVVIFVIWELIILAFLVFSAVSLYFRHMQLAFILVCITMLLLLCMKVTKQVRLARKKKRRMLLPLSMW